MANFTAPQCPLVSPVTWHVSFSNKATTISSIVVVVVQMIIIPFALFLNAATIFLIIKFESLQRERFIIVGLLSLTDLLSGLIAQPLLVAKELYHLVNKEAKCALDLTFYSSAALFWFVTIFQLTCLTYERYVAITDSFNYNDRISVLRFYQLSGGNWAINIFFITLYNTIIPVQFYLNIIITILVFSCCISFSYLNIRIFSVLRRHSTDIAKQKHGIKGEDKILYLAKRKNATTVMYIFGAFVLVNIPIIGDYIYTEFFAGNEIRTPLYFVFHPWVDVSLHLNSVLCPILYGLRTKEFRKRFLRYFFGINQEVNVFIDHDHSPGNGPAVVAIEMAELNPSAARSNNSNAEHDHSLGNGPAIEVIEMAQLNSSTARSNTSNAEHDHSPGKWT